MENKNLEQFLRNQLEQVQQTPDAEVWAKIAKAQAPLNAKWAWAARLQWLLPAAAAAAIMIGVVWWKGAEPAKTPVAPAQEMTLQAPAEEMPFAVAPEATPPPTSLTRRIAQPGAMAFNKVPNKAIPFDAEAGLNYQDPTTGTRIRIPAGALVDAAGQTARGQVLCRFREYRSIADFLASGIPMHFADERGNFFFNSGGMFEVRVEQDGQPLLIAPQRTYEVEFAPTHPLANANLFFLNEQSGQWEYVPVPMAPGDTPGTQARVVSAEEVNANNRRIKNDPCVFQLATRVQDSMPKAADVAKGIEVGYHLATGKMKMPTWFRKNPSLSVEAVVNHSDRGAVRLVHDRDKEDKFFPQDRSGNLAELSALKDCYFIKAADVDGQAVDLKEYKNTQWNGFWVIPDNGSRCKVEMLSDKGDKIAFFAVLHSNVSENIAEVLATYRRLRQERLEASRQTAVALKTFLRTAPIFQTPEEWCMSDTEWIAWFEAEKTRMVLRYEALIKSGAMSDEVQAMEAIRQYRLREREHFYEIAKTISVAGLQDRSIVFRLSGFGLYNYDQIFRLGQPEARVLAAFRAPNGSPIVSANVMILERKSRACFSLFDHKNLPLWAGLEVELFVTDKHGRNFHLPLNQYVALLQMKQHPEPCPIVLEDITAQTSTVSGWMQYLQSQDIAL
ncbi:MAG: hypothetical protein RMJ33_12755 [Saprospiraceae bacterium]|nr:hypothetical protein [Saprospiraceae bacterium]MDW8230698.1 hypothetical protein [Saprospiraceae bacterium]